MWPHKFIKTGHKKEIAEGHFLHRYNCVTCKLDWWYPQPQPQGPCPARKDQEELKRLLK